MVTNLVLQNESARRKRPNRHELAITTALGTRVCHARSICRSFSSCRPERAPARTRPTRKRCAKNRTRQAPAIQLRLPRPVTAPFWALLRCVEQGAAPRAAGSAGPRSWQMAEHHHHHHAGFGEPDIGWVGSMFLVTNNIIVRTRGLRTERLAAFRVHMGRGVLVGAAHGRGAQPRNLLSGG